MGTPCRLSERIRHVFKNFWFPVYLHVYASDTQRPVCSCLRTHIHECRTMDDQYWMPEGCVLKEETDSSLKTSDFLYTWKYTHIQTQTLTRKHTHTLTQTQTQTHKHTHPQETKKGRRLSTPTTAIVDTCLLSHTWKVVSVYIYIYISIYIYTRKGIWTHSCRGPLPEGDKSGRGSYAGAGLY